MYSNYNSSRFPSYSYSNIPMNSFSSSSNLSSDNRLIGGGFLGPFILGGVTGGLLAPAFYPRPYYRPYPQPYPPYYYGPYYR